MIEIEVKVRIAQTADVESRLRALGAFAEAPRQLEDDTLFDFPDRRLTKAGSLLRLRRRDDGGAITYKEEVSSTMKAKVRQEFEVGLAGRGDARAILEKLGFEPVWRYMKYRTTYRLGSLHALVDELPIGNFLELEGPKNEIDRWAGALGYSTDDYIVGSYRDLHREWIREHGLEDGDMVFPEDRD